MRVDDLLKHHLGELGRYQLIIILMLCCDSMFDALYNISAVFIMASPPHWCRNPLLESPLLSNCSHQTKLYWTVPLGEDGTGQWQFSSCQMYAVPNLTDILPSDVCSYNATFIAGQLSDRNNTPQNITLNGGPTPNIILQNLSTVFCDQWHFDTSESSTVASEWALVCNHAWKAKTVASVYLAGLGVGSFFFSWAADRFGRRKIIMFSVAALMACSLVCAFSPNYITFIIFRFLTSVFTKGKNPFVLAMEYTGPSKRVHVGTFYMIMWAVGYMLIALLAYFIRDWRMLIVAYTVPEFVFLVLFYFFVPESIRWLYMQERKEEADKIVREIAVFNKVELPQVLIIDIEKDTSSKSPLDLFRTPQILITSLIMMCGWFACGIVYYGLSFNTEELGDDPYINTLISGAIEIPAYFLISLTFQYLGHIIPYVACFFLSGVSLLAMIPIQSDDLHWMKVTLVMTGKFFMTSAFAMIFVVGSESYPTCIRNLGLHVTSVAARISSPVGPYITLLAHYSSILPSLVYGSVALMAGVLSLFLPEAKDQAMMQTIEDSEVFIKQNRLVGCNRRKKQALKPKVEVPAGPEAVELMTAI